MLRILEHPTGIPRPVSIILAYPCLDFNYGSWMSPANLRVLRTEQSETHIPGLMHGKDHMRHKSPLSVVEDVEPKARRRQKSWGQTLGEKIPGLTPASSPVIEKKRPPPLSPSTWTASLPRNVSAKVNGWLGHEISESADELPSSENSDSDNDDVVTVKAERDTRRDADKSLRERVKTPKHEKHFDLPPMDQPTTDAPPKRKKAPVGTRLTMTSRVGYFQDRVITPSMVRLGKAKLMQMRAMAILYVGPKRNPDFETDYYISPILSPPNLLAHFPPVYLICGERDPFVDDTVILAGKIRAAKRARRNEAEQLQSKSARFGESLRMSTSKALDGLDHIVRETDDDWVQMRIIEGWGHGFMQMSALMREVDGVLSEMADWIDESFAKATEVKKDAAKVRAAQNIASAVRPDVQIPLSPLDHLPPNQSTLVKPASGYVDLPQATGSGLADLDAPTQDVADDNDGVIAFTPKPKRKLTMPLSRFNPVPRRASKEQLHRSDSVPRFDADIGSSGETFNLDTPVASAQISPDVHRGAGVFAFFNSRGTGSSRPLAQTGVSSPAVHPAAFPYGAVPPPMCRTSSSQPTGDRKSNNPLLAAAAAGARAASPALAAAGFAPQNVLDVSEAELFRRRRMEAVLGLGDADSGEESDGESFEGEH